MERCLRKRPLISREQMPLGMDPQALLKMLDARGEDWDAKRIQAPKITRQQWVWAGAVVLQYMRNCKHQIWMSVSKIEGSTCWFSLERPASWWIPPKDSYSQRKLYKSLGEMSGVFMPACFPNHPTLLGIVHVLERPSVNVMETQAWWTTQPTWHTWIAETWSLSPC